MSTNKYLHIKSGRIYTLLNSCVINGTNDQNGQFMCLYEDHYGKQFVREITEFNKKFRKITEKEEAKVKLHPCLQPCDQEC